jgi:sialate O-acetylesterase
MKTKLKLLLTLSFVLLLIVSCKEKPSELKLSVIFADGMVLQQKSEAAIWGNAAPGSKISIEASWGAAASIEAKEDSSWQANIETPEAGGPYELTIKNSDSTLVLKDVLIGEVWLCSGQSNMEMPLEGWPPNADIDNSAKEIAEANYPEIRMFTVQRKYAFEPQKNMVGQWETCTPENAKKFSATAYFFGKKLHKELNVPIGLIHSSWGGTPSESWTKAEDLSKDEDYKTLTEDVVKLKETILKQENWLAKHEVKTLDFNSDVDPLETVKFSEDGLSKAEFDDTNWPVIEVPKYFEQSEIGNFDGVIWFRKEIEIPENWEGSELVLNLGPIDDRDWTYFNGELVGSMPQAGVWSANRNYTIPKELVKAGKAVIAVRVLDNTGGGGLYGAKDEVVLKKGDASISLSGEWKYLAVAEFKYNKFYLFDATKNELSERPVSTLQDGPNVPSSLYNGMIAPLLPYTIKGTIWYQGEANVGRAAQYSRIFPMMIENWRNDFNNPDMPFYFVQIAPFNYGGDDKTNSARIRDAQRRSMATKNTGMAVTLDIGNVDNIHPGNKQDVGLRLALWALAKDYAKEVIYSGPVYSKMEVVDGQAHISFTEIGGGLMLKDQNTTAFELAGEDGVFYPAKAAVEGEQIVLSSAKVAEPVAARYAFYDDSSAVLFNKEGLPASSFTTEQVLKN